MNVLVTGGAGYIGSHACKALNQKEYTPITYDNLLYGHRWAVRWGPLEVGDINDRARLDAVIQQYRPEAIMHFAAYAYVAESVLDPGKYYRNNVAGSLTLLEAARDHGIDKFIFSSSCATYGIPEQIPIPEEHPQHPINPYGASKLMIERMLSDFGSAYGLRSISLRYFNAAGADPDGEIGESHDPETHLIPLILDAAAGKRASITVNGDDYDTPDGTCIRDYIHVTDLADAHVLALQRLEKNDDCMKAGSKNAMGLNLANGKGFSVRQVIDTAGKVTGSSILVEMGPRRAGDPARLVGDARQAQLELRWIPKYTALEDILKTAWDWHKVHSVDEKQL